MNDGKDANDHKIWYAVKRQCERQRRRRGSERKNGIMRSADQQ
jgi:hypothetical protein